jgi:hypothetical protein
MVSTERGYDLPRGGGELVPGLEYVGQYGEPPYHWSESSGLKPLKPVQRVALASYRLESGA